MRTAKLTRETRETQISATLTLDGSGKAEISTGIGFFDHMLTAFAAHGGFDLALKTVGDLEVDCHHTIEDTGIVLGKLFSKALGDKGGIERYGSFSVPMDEALGVCHLDVSGRPFLVFSASFANAQVGTFDCCMTEEFFRAFCFHAGITLHIEVPYGTNDHHKIEAIFKAVAHALKAAVKPTANSTPLSTKGSLD